MCCSFNSVQEIFEKQSALVYYSRNLFKFCLNTVENIHTYFDIDIHLIVVINWIPLQNVVSKQKPQSTALLRQILWNLILPCI